MEFKYIKGSADDFTGAPDWATCLTISDNELAWEEFDKNIHGSRYQWAGCKEPYKYKPYHEVTKHKRIIAQREPIEERLGNGLDLCCEGADSSHPECLKLNEPVKMNDGKEYTINDDGTLKPYDVNWKHEYKVNAGINVNNDIESTLSVRGENYGVFADGAAIMRDLKSVMSATDGWEKLTPSQQEALDMIQHKIGRILNGKPDYDDNWRDIAGYATLILNELTGEGVK